MMAEERTPRPVFGEIMTGPALPPGPRRFMSADAVDADYESVPEQRLDPDQPRPPAAPATQGMDMLRKGEVMSVPRRGMRGGPLFWASGLGLVGIAFWISGGHALVRQVFPVGDARAANALNLSTVTSRIDDSGEKPVLIIDGEASNDGSEIVSLPPLAIKVRDGAGATIRYTLGTSGRMLKPGESFAFSSRLEAPRSEVKSVSVTFAE